MTRFSKKKCHFLSLTLPLLIRQPTINRVHKSIETTQVIKVEFSSKVLSQMPVHSCKCAPAGRARAASGVKEVQALFLLIFPLGIIIAKVTLCLIAKRTCWVSTPSSASFCDAKTSLP